MTYVFRNLAGNKLWECDDEYVARYNPSEPGYELVAAVQLLFSKFDPPPLSSDIYDTGVVHTRYGRRFSVGPFDLYVEVTS